MKLRSKLLLSATCLLTISVAATATSAYAWFVSNRQATVAINKADVKTNATNLKITGSISDGNGTVNNPIDNKSTTISSTVVATDISGDGIKFFKPRLSPGYNGTDNWDALKIEEVTADQNYYHEFKLTFSQTNENVNTGVFLSSDSSVLLHTTEGTKNVGLSLCTRVAFIKEAEAEAETDELLLYWAPNRTSGDVNTGDANKSYIKAPYDGSGNPVSIEDGTSSDYLQLVSAGDSTMYGKSIYKTITNVDDSTDKKDEQEEHLLTLAGKTPQTITVRIWFEGMDSACDSKYLKQTIDANLKFNGVNMDI